MTGELRAAIATACIIGLIATWFGGAWWVWGEIGAIYAFTFLICFALLAVFVAVIWAAIVFYIEEQDMKSGHW